MKKEEGAAVDSSAIFYPTFPQRAVSSGRTGSVLPWKNPKHWESPINYLKCPTNETAIFSHLIDSPKQMKQMKQKCS